MPETLHAANPTFIPPFPGSVAKYLKPDSPFQRVHGKIFPFVATRDGKSVGRIAAVIYQSHNDRYHDTVGFFGWFDCENNPETAKALFEKAAEVLKEHGRTSMRGPYSPSINDECGLLVWEAGTRGPCIGLTWNPPYYESLVLAAGLEGVRDLHGYDLPMERLEVPERLQRLSSRAEKRAKLRLRPINLKKLEKELELVHEVYNDTLGRNWGFVPISMEDLLGAADDMRSFADPNIILIAEKDDEPAGVALTLPDFNQILAGLQRVPHWLRLPVILWRMKTRKITACRQMVYGVIPKFRDHGLHAWLLREQFSEAKKRYPLAELGWMEENNTQILAACTLVGGFHQRTWRIYEKPLAAATA